jgi:putative tryptophan/tyrosine transport system substrate-binding protein
MRRREFITLIGVGAAAWPLVARAQQPVMPTIGILSNPPRNALTNALATFKSALSEAGYVEGNNLSIEYRFADGQVDRPPAFAADLVSRNVAVLITIANAAALAAKAATTAIPILFIVGGDPVKLGSVESLNRPGGNATGMTLFSSQLKAKRLGLLHELVPRVTELAVLINPNQPNASDQEREVTDAAPRLGVQARIVYASSEVDLDPAFAACARAHAGGLLVTADPFFHGKRQQIFALAARDALPAIYEFRDYAESGGLASYGTSLAHALRQVGEYAAKILAGAKVADLPALQSTKFEFIVNLKTAKALGLEIPPMLLARDDEVIE